MRRLLPPLVGLALTVIAVPVMAASGTSPTTGPTPSASPSPAASPSASPDPLAQQLQQALRDQAAVAAAKAALAGEVEAAKSQQSNLAALALANRAAIDATLGQIATAEQAYADAITRAAHEHAAAADARRRQHADEEALSSFVRDQYMRADGMATYLLSSSSFSQLMSRASILQHLSDVGAGLLQDVRQDVDDAEAAEEAATWDSQTAARQAATLSQQRDELQRQLDDEQALIDRLQGQARAALTEIAQADSQSAQLAQQIADLRIQQLDETILAAEQASWDAATYYMQHNILGLPPGISTGQAQPGSVRFVWPVPGSTFTQMFGPSPYPFEPAAFGYPHFHTGIDMAAAMGTPVYAAADGVVVAANSSTVGYGNNIIIAHDQQTLTLYGHLETMLVKPGQQVRQGQLIALMGSTGNSTGPHTHFEVRVNGVPVNPVPFLPPLPAGASGPPPLPAPLPA